jgi:hypothetical protein
MITWSPKARFQFAQVAEKSMDANVRKFFDFGKVHGEYMPGTAAEVFQAEAFEKEYSSLNSFQMTFERTFQILKPQVQILRGNDYTVSKKDGKIQAEI